MRFAPLTDILHGTGTFG